MREDIDGVPEIMTVDVKRLEKLLGDNDIVDTDRLSLDTQLTKVVLRRVVDQNAEAANAIVLQYAEVIGKIPDFADYTWTVELLAQLEDLGVSPQGDVFSGYALLRVITDSHMKSSSVGFAIQTNGSIKAKGGKNKITTQREVNELIEQMLDALSKRRDDSRDIMRSLIGISRKIEEQGVISRFGDDKAQKTSESPIRTDTIATPKLPRAEVIDRLEKIKAALRKQIIALSPPAS